MSVIKECIRRFREEAPKPKESRTNFNEESFWWIRSSSELESLGELNNIGCSLDTDSSDNERNTTNTTSNKFCSHIYQSGDISQFSFGRESEDNNNYDDNYDDNLCKNNSIRNIIADVIVGNARLDHVNNNFNCLENPNVFHMKPYNLLDDNGILDKLDEYASDLLLQCDHFLAFNADGSDEMNAAIDKYDIVDKDKVKSSTIGTSMPKSEIGINTSFDGSDNKVVGCQGQYISKGVQTKSCHDVDIFQTGEILEIKQSIDVIPTHNKVKLVLKPQITNSSIESNDVFYLSSVENSSETLINVLETNKKLLNNVQSQNCENQYLSSDMATTLSFNSINSNTVYSDLTTNDSPVPIRATNVESLISIPSCDGINMFDSKDENLNVLDKNLAVQSTSTNANSFFPYIGVLAQITHKEVNVRKTVEVVNDENVYIDPLTGLDLREFLVTPALRDLWRIVINKK